MLCYALVCLCYVFNVIVVNGMDDLLTPCPICGRAKHVNFPHSLSWFPLFYLLPLSPIQLLLFSYDCIQSSNFLFFFISIIIDFHLRE
jgi:hypothetical protein